MSIYTPMLIFLKRNGELINQNEQKWLLRGEVKYQGGVKLL